MDAGIIVGLIFFIVAFGGTTALICYAKHCEKLVEPFLKEIKELKNTYISYNDAKQFLEKYKELNSRVARILIGFSSIQDFRYEYDHLMEDREKYNHKFIYSEIDKFDRLFSNIENKSLDEQQRIACVVSEDANLVVAGAGSGKTLTICGKVQYLIEKGVDPREILCISFTNKVCEELKARLKKFTKQDIDVLTFHKLALKVLNDNDVEYKIADENRTNQMLQKALQGARTKDLKTLILNLLVYCDNYVKLQAETNKAEEMLITMKDTINHAKELSRLQKYKRGSVDLITLAQEKVKSQQELEIANFLFINGINYEYEADYKFIEDKATVQYRPDFYLPDYDIYIEHFGIDESGTASWLDDEEKISEYSRIMELKKKLHEENETRLVCTYSYQREELTDILLKELQSYNVEIKPCSIELIELLNKIYDFDSSFLETVSSFIKLFKNRNFEEKEFDKFIKTANIHERYVLGLIKQIYIDYQSQLEEKGLIDFEDMINRANKEFNKRVKIPNYKYIIVDEYQDVSINKINLLKNFIKQNTAKLIAVGDDWQSIYRFAGSEVSLISNFGEEFDHYRMMKIEKTYRNSKELIQVSGNFIQKNKNQIKKELYSVKECKSPVEIHSFAEKPTISPTDINSKDKKDKYIAESVNDPRIKLLEHILDKISKENNKNVLLLVRNNFDQAIIQLWIENKEAKTTIVKNDNGRLIFKKNDLTITCMTMHKSKGLESDAVVLFDIREGFRGLPDTLGDDNILKFVIASREKIEYAEDRRLFYVALTRTKNKVYIIARTREQSRFIKEISEDYIGKVDSDIEAFKCPKCGGNLVQIPGQGFYGCENYITNKCSYTINASTDEELKTIRRYQEMVDRFATYGCYLPSTIENIEWVAHPIGDAAIKVKYAVIVGNTKVWEFTTFINKKDDYKNTIKTSRFITTLRKDDVLDPFDNFEEYKKKYTGARHQVHVVKAENGIETISLSDWYFRPIEE